MIPYLLDYNARFLNALLQLGLHALRYLERAPRSVPPLAAPSPSSSKMS